MRLSDHAKPDIERVYQQYADLLYRLSLAQLSSDADAQDVVQDVFIKYMSAAPVFRDGEHERAWFLRVTVNCCRDFARRRKLRDAAPIEEALDVAAEQGDFAELMGTLRRIPQKYRDTVILHCLEGFTLEETAAMLHISLSAAKMRLARAREALRTS